ncbi:hypothetical protein D3C85_1393380 [compost metagenome]
MLLLQRLCRVLEILVGLPQKQTTGQFAWQESRHQLDSGTEQFLGFFPIGSRGNRGLTCQHLLEQQDVVLE